MDVKSRWQKALKKRFKIWTLMWVNFKTNLNFVWINMKIFQLVYSKCYSNFICDACSWSLNNFSSFRDEILSQQQKLMMFLCRIKPHDPGSEIPLSQNSVKLEPRIDSIQCLSIVVKAEPLEENFQDEMILEESSIKSEISFESSPTVVRNKRQQRKR